MGAVRVRHRMPRVQVDACSAGRRGARGAGASSTAAVKVGEPMPDFALNYLEPARDWRPSTAKTAKLSDYEGKQVVVLAFFPAAFSPG